MVRRIRVRRSATSSARPSRSATPTKLRLAARSGRGGKPPRLFLCARLALPKSMVQIRPARLEDAAVLAALKLVTFRQTFLQEGFGIPYPAADLAEFEA